MHTDFLRIVWAAGVIVMLTGCGGGDGNVATTGTVTMVGKPLTKGFVQFSDLNGQTAVGNLDAEGRFEVRSSRTESGMKPGKYQVAVVAWEVEPDMDVEGVPMVDPTFMNPNTSPLEAEVTEDGDNTFEFAVAPPSSGDISL